MKRTEVSVRLPDGGYIRLGYLPRTADLDVLFPDRIPAAKTERLRASLVVLSNGVGLILDSRSFIGWFQQKSELAFLRFDETGDCEEVLEMMLATLMAEEEREERRRMWEHALRRRRHWEPEPPIVIPVPTPPCPRPPRHPRPPRKSEPIYGIQPVPPVIRVPRRPHEDDNRTL